MSFCLATTAAALAALVGTVAGETHIISLVNNCGRGTPTLIQGTNVLSTGDAFTSFGPLFSARAFLQTDNNGTGFQGSCGFYGEGCTLVETTLANIACGTAGSSADISLVSPHNFSVTSGFGYFNGPCDGAGADCGDANCTTALHNSNDTSARVACQEDNANLAITFCD